MCIKFCNYFYKIYPATGIWWKCILFVQTLGYRLPPSMTWRAMHLEPGNQFVLSLRICFRINQLIVWLVVQWVLALLHHDIHISWPCGDFTQIPTRSHRLKGARAAKVGVWWGNIISQQYPTSAQLQANAGGVGPWLSRRLMWYSPVAHGGWVTIRWHYPAWRSRMIQKQIAR